MTSFALITEGVTDQVVIENILYGFLNSDDIEVNWVQPLRDETDKSKLGQNFGNWQLVFEYCRSKKFSQVFQLHDYVVVQIDTDDSDKAPFNVPKLEAGKELLPLELIEKVKQRLVEEMGDDTYRKYHDKIIFAVCVHSLECWLLPLYCTKKQSVKIKGCLNTLNRALAKQNKKTISSNGKNVQQYNKLSMPYYKHKILMNERNNKRATNPSLEIFIAHLERVLEG